MSEYREKFQNLLRELFQFDCADLDFGIYRIMNHKRDVIDGFISDDLLKAVGEELDRGALAGQEQARQELEERREKVEESFGKDAIDGDGNLAEQYHATPLGKEYLEALARSAGRRGRDALEATVFNHLYTFFSRYYQDGDFISKRRYSKREKYAIPYNGEEVYLYWANHDQYYVKTGEYFNDYSFRSSDVTVHFRVTQADVEQNNVKGEKRFFVPRLNEIAWDEAAGELEIPFEYRPLTDQESVTYGKRDQQQKILDEAVEAIPGQLGQASRALAALSAERRRDAGGNPVTALEHHLRQYTRRNTADFFIHKDLKGFLTRELDFYLKNEVLSLDELEVAGEQRGESWFQLMRVIKAVGGRIIEFLDQIESFQKMLWEKRKFVTDVQYCITVGNIDESFYPEIADCEAQWDEWKELLHIDEEQADLFTAGKSKKDRRIEFLKAHPSLPLDTRHFDAAFTDRLLESPGDLDELTDGLLVHSENWQALTAFHKRYAEIVSTVYIDPPYNTEEDRATGKFLYKDDYEHSSWLSMLSGRLHSAQSLIAPSGSLFCSIDEAEFSSLTYLLRNIFGPGNVLTPFKWKRNRKAAMLSRFMGTVVEFLIPALKDRSQSIGFLWGESTDRTRPILNADNPISDRLLRPGIEAKCGDCVMPAGRHGARTLHFELLDDAVIKDGKLTNEVRVRGPFRVNQEMIDQYGYITKQKALRRYVGEDEKALKIPLDLIDEDECRNETGKEALDGLFGSRGAFSNPKPPKYIENVIKMSGTARQDPDSEVILDFFAGSGTTGHAVINLNREDGGKRMFTLIEMGEYFDTVLLPRLKKVTFTPEWKNGKPKRMATAEEAERSPRIIKYLRLESYEDALNNIAFEDGAGQGALQFDDYLLKYMLGWETRKSETLLNTERLESPFDYALNIHRDGETRRQPVDVPETFNYLLGLHVERRRVLDDDGRRYLVYRGRIDHRRVAVIWRETAGWTEEDLERDKRFVADNALADGADEIFVNGDSFIPGAKALEPLFKARMFAPVEA